MVNQPYDAHAQQDEGGNDQQVTHTGYNAVVSGDPSGWTLGAPTSSTVQMGTSPSSNDLVTYTRYDSAGHTVETRLPGDSGGTGPRTTLITYYTAAGSGICGNNPQSAGLVCQTAPAGQPSSGKPLGTTVYTYDQYGHILTKTETYGSTGTVRITADTYDTIGRLKTSNVSVSPSTAGGTVIPTVSYGYDNATGLPAMTSMGSGANIQTVTRAYNAAGEMTSFQDANGNTSIYHYDLDGRTTSVNDGMGTISYTYDGLGTNEHRGLVTNENIGVQGQLSAFTATYDAAGNVATETYPTGLTATSSFDNANNYTKLVYANAGATWMTFTETHGDSNHIVKKTGPQSSQNYVYDNANRLLSVQDATSTGCLTRTYQFDADSNRTGLNAYPSTTGGACSTSTTPATTSYTFDQADRLTSDTAGSYTYDDLGRTITVPSADSIGDGQNSTTGETDISYYSNDMVAQESQGGAAIQFTLDPLLNRVAQYSQSGVTTTNHYSSEGDSPSWSTTGTSVSRYLPGICSGLAATVDQGNTVTLDLTDMTGDVVATTPDMTSSSTPPSTWESTEYGQPRTPASTIAPYAWKGAEQRSDVSLGGLILMGARLYNPQTGRFLSLDPVHNANANDYVYPDDPEDSSDTSGLSQTYYSTFGRAQEGWCIEFFWDCDAGFSDANAARDYAAKLRRHHMTPDVTDAFQHTVWMALLSYQTDSAEALALGEAHEIDTWGENSLTDTLRDLHNNVIGASIGAYARHNNFSIRYLFVLVWDAFYNGDLWCTHNHTYCKRHG